MEVNLLIDESEINDYLGEAKKLILDGKFRIALNSNRLTNLSIFDEYLINEESVKSILLNLTVYDFCEKVQNKHANFNHEWLYVFGKEINLMKKVKWFHCILSLISLKISFLLWYLFINKNIHWCIIFNKRRR